MIFRHPYYVRSLKSIFPAIFLLLAGVYAMITSPVAIAQTQYELVIIEDNLQAVHGFVQGFDPFDPLTSRYALAGPASSPSDNSSDAHLLIMDGNGSILYENYFSSDICPGETADTAASIDFYDGGGVPGDAAYYMLGTTACGSGGYSEMYAVKTDLSGTGVVESRYALAQDVEYEGRAVRVKPGGIVIAGDALNKDADLNDRDTDIVLITADYNLLQNGQAVHGDMDHNEQAWSVAAAYESGELKAYIVAGSIAPVNGSSSTDAYMVKISSGNLTEKCVWTSNDANDTVFTSVIQDSSGSIVAVGRTTAAGGTDDVIMHKFDMYCTPVWTEPKIFGGTGIDIAHSVSETPYGGYLIVGTTSSTGLGGQDMYVIKTDSGGNLEWEKTFGGLYSDRGTAGMTVDGDYLIAGTTSSYSDDDNIFVVRTGNTGETPATTVDDVRITITAIAEFKKDKTEEKLLKKLDKIETALNAMDYNKAEKELCKMFKHVSKKVEKEIVLDSAFHIQTDLLNLADDNGIDLPCTSRFALAQELPQAVTSDTTLYEKAPQKAALQAASEVVEGVHPVDPYTSRYALAGNAINSIDDSSDAYLVIIDIEGNIKNESYFSSAICSGSGIPIDSAASIDFYDGVYPASSQTAGYYLFGTTVCNDNARSEMYLVKTDLEGTGLWESRYALASQIDYEGASVRITSEGLAMAGTALNKNAMGVDTDYDMAVVTAFMDGAIKSSVTFGDAVHHEKADDIAPVYDMAGAVTEFIIAGSIEPVDGSSSMDAYLVWLTPNLTVDTSWTAGDADDSAFSSVIVDSGGNFVAVGYTASAGEGGTDVYLVKFDSAYNKLWEYTFGDTDNEEAVSVRETADGGYLVTGTTSSFGAGADDMYVIKTDVNGYLEWERTFGGIRNDAGTSGINTSDGDYLFVGNTESFGTDQDIFIVKADDQGATPEKLVDDVRISVINAVYKKEDFKQKLLDKLDKIEEALLLNDTDKAGKEICHFLEELQKKADTEIEMEWAIRLQSEIVNLANDNGIGLPCGSRYALA